MGASRLAMAAGLLAAAAPLSVLAACTLGPLSIPPHKALGAVMSLLTGHGTPGAGHPDPALLAVTQLRLPRALLSYGVGAGLSMAGAIFQGLLRNPLADPFTIGVSTGAAFGAALGIALGLGAGHGILLAGLHMGALPLAALAGGLAALGVVLALAKGTAGSGGLRRETLVLAGIVTATSLSAGIALIKALDEEAVSGIVFWIMGSFQGRGWAELALYAPYLMVGGVAALLLARQLDVLTLGEEQARLLGLNPGPARLRLLLAASALSAAAVAVSGVIGFVGLVVPHAVRLALGGENRPLLLVSSLAGGLTLLWADALARSLPAGGAELPVGVVTALTGGPCFLLLLRRRNREAQQ